MARVGCSILLLVLLAGCALALPDEVLQLTTANFEHDTQASTGQTTGNWAVLFADPQDSAQEPWVELWSELAQVEYKTKIYAQVDSTSNEALIKRFGIQQVPAVLLFKDRKMYRYPGTALDKEEVVTFLDAGHIEQGGETVPAPQSSWEELLKKITPQDKLNRYGAYVAVGFIPLLLLALLLLPKDPQAAAALLEARELRNRAKTQ